MEIEQLRHTGTIELGALACRIVEDTQGRQCVAIKLGHQEVLFTATQALLVREILDAAIRSMTRYSEVPAVEAIE